MLSTVQGKSSPYHLSRGRSSRRPQIPHTEDVTTKDWGYRSLDTVSKPKYTILDDDSILR